jgi:hypothetical protein
MGQLRDVTPAIIQDLLAFFGGERPSLDDALPHRVFVFRPNRIDAEIRQCTEQALAFRWQAPVYDAAKHGREIEHLCRERPTQCQVAGALGVSDEANEQDASVCAERWRLAQLVAPKPKGPPRAQFLRTKADHIGTLAGLRNEFEVLEPYLFEEVEERQQCCINRGHEQPTF